MKTIGIGSALPVCTSVSTSNPSSIVPNPPGNKAMAWPERTNMSLRVKKYLKLTSFLSFSMNGLVFCSKGRRMARPKDGSAPAPPWPAALMPPPAPVMTCHPAAAIALPKVEARPPGGAHVLPKGGALPVVGVALEGARRAEDAHLAQVAVGGEDLQGVA